MASRKDIKKDILYLTEQVIVEILENSESIQEEKKNDALDIIKSVVELHNDLIVRVNHIDGKDNPILVKIHFKKIIDELLAGCNSAYNRLNTLVSE